MLDTTSKTGQALLAAAGGTVPSLPELFSVGQFVRCVVVGLPAK
jgi:hypothetical protein